ncbi:MAG: hypothetical protein SGPRY_011589, partial [Prymnesium sp.]
MGWSCLRCLRLASPPVRFEPPRSAFGFDADLEEERAAACSVKQGLAPLLFGKHAEGALPMWVADMDLPCCEEVRCALARRCEHPTFGYTFIPAEAWRRAAAWLYSQQGWNEELTEDNFVFSP